MLAPACNEISLFKMRWPMKRSAALSILFAVMLLALGLIAEAQQVKRVPLIGYLSVGDAASPPVSEEGFRSALRELGYIKLPVSRFYTIQPILSRYNS